MSSLPVGMRRSLRQAVANAHRPTRYTLLTGVRRPLHYVFTLSRYPTVGALLQSVSRAHMLHDRAAVDRSFLYTHRVTLSPTYCRSYTSDLFTNKSTKYKRTYDTMAGTERQIGLLLQLPINKKCQKRTGYGIVRRFVGGANNCTTGRNPTLADLAVLSICQRQYIDHLLV